jgi:hypothetical protein
MTYSFASLVTATARIDKPVKGVRFATVDVGPPMLLPTMISTT